MTDRERELEARLVQAERLESIGRLAGGIAHDFNNLLTAILGFTELLLRARRADDPDRPYLEEIERAGQRAAALTQQLLAFGRRQVLVPKDVDVNAIVLGMQAMLRRLVREDIALTFDVPPAPSVARIDPTQIEQAILNLVLNARDALPVGGAIHIDVTSDAVSVRVRVADNGDPIPADARAHLFEPFFTAKDNARGGGLGLASVYGIVRQSNGWITVDEGPAGGTVFTMTFPASAAASVAGPERSAAPPRENETILVVEDEDAVRSIVGTVLQRRGYEVLEAASASEAMEIFEKRSGSIDLLLTDVVMPGMNGPALAQRLVALQPALRVLFMSGYTDIATLAIGHPHIGFLRKPFETTQLTDAVARMLARRDDAAPAP